MSYVLSAHRLATLQGPSYRQAEVPLHTSEILNALVAVFVFGVHSGEVVADCWDAGGNIGDLHCRAGLPAADTTCNLSAGNGPQREYDKVCELHVDRITDF